MKVIIGTESLRNPLSGIGVYTLNLCKEIIKDGAIELIGLDDFGIFNQNQLIQVINNIDENHSPKNSHSFNVKHLLRKKIRQIPASRALYNKVSSAATNRNLKSLSNDYIYHSPNYISRKFSGKKVITVHDISHIDCPETHPKDRINHLEKNLSQSIQSADHIIVDSEFTKNQLIKSSLITSNTQKKITTVHLAACPSFTKRDPIETQGTLQKYSLSHKKYLLSIGTLEPRKNYENIISAFLALPDSIASQYELIIIGAKGWKYENIFKLLNNTNSTHHIKLLGYLPQREMIDLLSSAKIFLYPSLYEGFGLPILESMSCSTPVITSNIGAMQEVAGNCAELVNPYDIEEIRDSITHILNSKEHCDNLIQLGKKRSSQFSWASTAKQTIDIYKSINKL